MVIEGFIFDWQTFGIAGVFLSYLIYDRQVIIGKLIATLDANTDAVNNMASIVEFVKKR